MAAVSSDLSGHLESVRKAWQAAERSQSGFAGGCPVCGEMPDEWADRRGHGDGCVFFEALSALGLLEAALTEGILLSREDARLAENYLRYHATARRWPRLAEIADLFLPAK